MLRLITLVSVGLTLISAQFSYAAGSAASSIIKNSASTKAVNTPKPAMQAGEDIVGQDNKPAPEKAWTIMVFMNGKNNVAQAAMANVNEMEAVGTTANVNVVAEGGFLKDGKYSVARYVIGKDDNFEQIASPIVQTFDRMDMGDYRNAVTFVQWAKAKFPAKRYMLVIWNHGTGFFDPKKDNPAAQTLARGQQKGISFDDETGNYISTPDLRKLLAAVGGVDVLAFNACLMSALEVYSEVGGRAKAVVASEDVMSAVGFDYESLISTLDQKPSMSANDAGMLVAAGFIERIKAFMSFGIRGGHITVANPSKMKALNTAIKAWTVNVMAAKDDAAVIKAIQTALLSTPRASSTISDDKTSSLTSFMGDMGIFVATVTQTLTPTNGSKATPQQDAIVSSGKALLDIMFKDVVLGYAAAGKDDHGVSYDDSTGVSVYLPPRLDKIDQATLEEKAFADQYSNLSFAKDSGWGDFVKWLYTVRPAISMPKPAQETQAPAN